MATLGSGCRISECWVWEVLGDKKAEIQKVKYLPKATAKALESPERQRVNRLSQEPVTGLPVDLDSKELLAEASH